MLLDVAATLALVGLEISQTVGRTLDSGRDRLSADWPLRPHNAAEQAATARLASKNESCPESLPSS